MAIAVDVTRVLDELMGVLDAKVARERERGQGDAIDAVLGAGRRTTNVRSAQEAPEVVAFREALVDGLIRVDTANRLLRLIHELVVRLV